MGRPTELQLRAKRRAFMTLLANGATWRQAAKDAGLKADTVLTMLDQPEFSTVVAALLDGRSGPVAVTVATNSDRLAA